MAKLLIVEDHLKMVRMIQKHIQEINPLLTSGNTFCFSPKPPLKLCSLDSIPNEPDRVLLAGEQNTVFSSVFTFLNEHSYEDVLILIDVLLNSQNISAPSLERYRADHEYSCELYAELLRVKNGKQIPNCNNINPNRYFHVIYSRSDSSIGVVAAALSELYCNQSKTDKQFFPKECSLFKNISWCRNGYDATDPDFGVSESQKDGSTPLALPSGYKEFIRDLK